MLFTSKLLSATKKTTVEGSPVKGWISDFLKEVVDNGTCYVWQDCVGITVARLGEKAILINHLYVPPEHRNQGKAKSAMGWLCDLADKHKVQYKLVADNEKREGGLSNNQLATFYKSFGFVPSFPDAKGKYKKQLTRNPK